MNHNIVGGVAKFLMPENDHSIAKKKRNDANMQR